MRCAVWAVFAASLLTVAPATGAGSLLTPEEHVYVVTSPDGGVGRDGPVLQNGATFFPTGGTHILVAVEDSLAASVFVRICHEWTYDDGSHPTVVCTGYCSHADEMLRFPPGPGITYRLVVDLRKGPGACDAKPTAGTMRAVIR